MDKHKITQFCKRNAIFRSVFNIMLKKIFIKGLLSEGILRFKSENVNKDLYKDFVYCVKKFAVSYDEYMYQFKFFEKNDSERNEFMSQVTLRLFYNTYLKPKDEEIFWNKVNFLREYSKFIKRDWIDGGVFI